MKRIFLLSCIICIVLISNSLLMAGGIDNRSNYSGEYLRTLNRNAATDSLDAIAYNPAGVMKMEDGKKVNFSIHYGGKDYANIVDGVALGSDTPSFIPALFGLYKSGQWAGFFGFTSPAGGGKVEYDSGNARTRIGGTTLINMLNAGYWQAEPALTGVPIYDSIAGERLEGESMYYAFTFGGAYKVDDVISFSFAARYIDANKDAYATLQVIPSAAGVALIPPPHPMSPVPRTAVLDYEEEAEGIGVMLGMHIDYQPFTIGVRYESETELDFEYAVNADSVGLGAGMGIIPGREHARNLPAILAVGIGYQPSPRFRIEVDLTSYFNEDADWGGDENYVTDGYDAGILFEYMPNPELKFTFGYLKTDTGMQPAAALYEAPELDANSFAAGFMYKMNDNIKIDCGITLANYDSDSYVDWSSGTPISIVLEKEVLLLSAGIQYSF